ncbi:MAG: P1 family peptidase [Ardenticatenaceae bacterium]
MTRARLRDLGITIGRLPTGRYNAITDVSGVWVGHSTLVADDPRVARTGVTVVLPREDGIRDDYAFAGYHRFNGNGEMTGLPWIEESGLLTSPVAITNTHQVGVVRDALIEYELRQHEGAGWRLPVVAETWDGFLNDINAFHLTKAHLFEAMADAKSGPVAEGNVGGGTGMICHGFKGGIGTSSRVVSVVGDAYTVGVLVQSNYGARRDLRVDGVPVGREIDAQRVPLPWSKPVQSSSIIVIIATDAPLLPVQCNRLAQRATVGLARVGGRGYNSSGDIFLAFATGNHVPSESALAFDKGPGKPIDLHMLPHNQLDPFFDAVAEATEEAILNALTAAETMVGFKGRVAHALPLDELRQVMKKYGH